MLAGATVATLAYASASVLDVESKPLQAGHDSVTCDGDGVDVAWGLETDKNLVSTVKVSDIDKDCWDTGAKLFVAVDGVPVLSGGASPKITGATHSLPLPAGTTPESINDVKVWIG